MQIGVDSQRAVENRRVYVIDADDVISMALQFMLADEMETHVFASTGDALAKSDVFPPEVILLGMGTLQAEGTDTVPLLLSRIPQAKVVVVCQDAQAPLVEQALQSGACATLLRPLKLETVRRRVDGLLGRRQNLNIQVVQS